MIYKHPATYKGTEGHSDNYQNIQRCIVEKYCMKCDDFMGKEHDFSECKDTCQMKQPYGFAVPMVNAGAFVFCKVDNSTCTGSDRVSYLQRLKAYAEELQADPCARQVLLQQAGILDREGNYTELYRELENAHI